MTSAHSGPARGGTAVRDAPRRESSRTSSSRAGAARAETSRRGSRRPTPAPPRRRGLRRTPVVLLLVCALLAGGLWWWDHGSGVGSFPSTAAQARYGQAYASAMTRLPRPARSLELRTDLGVVRVHQFPGANPGRPPLVLLSDRARATPDWDQVLGRLLKQRSVFTVDTLGDAGMSVPSRALETDSDAANWLWQVLGQLPGGPFVLVGDGSGAWAATNLVVRRQFGSVRPGGGPVAGLVVVDPEQVLSENSLAEKVRRGVLAAPGRPESWQRDWITGRTGRAELGPGDELALAGVREHRDGSRVGAAISQRQLRALELPVLVLLAQDSSVHDGPASAELARGTLPHATVTELPGTDLLHTRPEDVTAALGGWLSR